MVRDDGGDRVSADPELTAVVDAAEDAMRALGWMPIKVLVLADVMMPDGERNVCLAPSSDMRSYDALGLLHYAVARETAGVAGEMQSE